MRDFIRWLKIAVLTLARELSPGRLPTLHPLAKASLVVVAGICLAFVLPVDARPAALTDGLAVQRLERFLQNKTGTPVSPVPQGRILAPRPCFHWPAVEGASRYDFRLVWDGGEIRRKNVREPRYLMPTPGRLESGRDYQYSATAYGARGKALSSPVEGEFTVAEPSQELADLEAMARLDLEPSEVALILAGYYAENGSPSDVVAGLEAYLKVAPGGQAAPLAQEILQRLGCR